MIMNRLFDESLFKETIHCLQKRKRSTSLLNSCSSQYQTVTVKTTGKSVKMNDSHSPSGRSYDTNDGFEFSLHYGLLPNHNCDPAADAGVWAAVVFRLVPNHWPGCTQTLLVHADSTANKPAGIFFCVCDAAPVSCSGFQRR